MHVYKIKDIHVCCKGCSLNILTYSTKVHATYYSIPNLGPCLSARNEIDNPLSQILIFKEIKWTFLTGFNYVLLLIINLERLQVSDFNRLYKIYY